MHARYASWNEAIPSRDSCACTRPRSAPIPCKRLACPAQLDAVVSLAVTEKSCARPRVCSGGGSSFARAFRLTREMGRLAVVVATAAGKACRMENTFRRPNWKEDGFAQPSRKEEEGSMRNGKHPVVSELCLRRRKKEVER